ncbi:MAG: nuclear transport factor 2 family protein [Lewinella sp.]|nr:nuclear transport factor 2 family protein [Lewinella sp.]
MNRFLLLTTPLLFFATLPLAAQETSAEQAVIAVLEQLFDGMRASDSVSVREVFHPDARLHSVSYNAEGQPVVRYTPIDRFVSQVGQLPPGTLNEQIWTTTLELDGPLATAWTEYTLFVNLEMSHCGYNAFQLAETPDGWRIIQVTDTRRKEGCRTEAPAVAEGLHAFIDDWHQAAAVADADAFFGAMAPEGIYLGTDASERWLRDELREWAAFAFERESAWAFTPHDRHLYFSADERFAWWEELLDTRFGLSRGSGVAVWRDGRWHILHYDLAVTVPNEKMDSFIELMKE